MRIAVAAHTPARAGGVESYLTTIVPALRQRGHDVACLFETSSADPDPILSDRSQPVWIAGREPARAVDAWRGWRPDVVFAHGMRSQALETQLLAAAPSVFFAHSYYGTCVSGAKSHRIPSDRTCTRVFGAGCLLHYYPRRCGGWNPLTMVRQYELQRDRRDTLEQSTRIAVASSHMAAEYARHGFERKVRIVPLPVTLGAAVPQRGRGRRRLTLLYLGRLERTKGADLAIPAAALAAAALDRPLHLKIAGHGTLAATLREDAARAAQTRSNLTVEVTGWLTRAGCEEALSAADLLLLPSRWPEPFGLVGLEAAANGVPAVAFEAGGIRDWLTDGVNGRLVPTDPPDVQRFAEAIVDCLRDSSVFARLQQQARHVSARFSVDAHAAALEQVFGELAGAVPAAVVR